MTSLLRVLKLTVVLSLVAGPWAQAVIGGIAIDELQSRNKNIIMHNTVRFVLKKNGKIEHLCSGVIVGDGQVLSAAHCFNEDDVVSALKKGRVAMGYFDPERPGRFASILIGPQAVHFPDDNKVDLAFIRVNTDFPNKENLPLADKGCASDSPYIVAGFGTSLDSSSATDLEHLKLRSVKMKKAANPDGVTTALEEIYDPQTGQGKGIGCFGDSGGPTFCKDSAGQWVLEGINHTVYPRAQDTPEHPLSGRELCESARFFRSTSIKWNKDVIHHWLN